MFWKKITSLISIVALTLALPWGVAEAVSSQPAPGVKYTTFTRQNISQQPIKGFMLDINPKQSLLEIRPVLSKDKISGTQTLSQMAASHGAVAGVNGSFFGGDGVPVGNVVIDGNTLKNSDIFRTSFGLTKDGGMITGYLDPVMAVHLPGNASGVPVDLVNSWPQENKVGIYTSEWGDQTPQSKYALKEVAVTLGQDGTGKVTAIGAGYLTIPTSGYVVSFWGDKADLAESLKVGDKVSLGQFYGDNWKNLNHALTAGPLLVDKGLPVFNAVDEGFRSDILAASPRTAIGLKSDGHIILVVVDGRQAGYSVGLTLEEMAYLMRDLGAVKAVGLDGGGSSEMWVQGQVVNKPSDKVERGLSNAILVLDQIPVYLNNQRLWFDQPPVMESNRVLLPLRSIFEGLGATVDYQNGTITAQKDNTSVILKVGSNQATINGTIKTLDVAAKTINGRTLVPLRFVGEALGATVKWDDKTSSVFIQTGQGAK